MKDKMIILSLMWVVFVFMSCEFLRGKDDELSIQKKPYDGNELRLDGYYYDNYIDDYIQIYFFYRNGVILDGGNKRVSELNEREEEFKNGTFYSNVSSFKLMWGVFNIDGDSIEFEHWYPTEGPFPAYIRSGKILNDTTFHITGCRRSDGSERSDKDEMYHFKHLVPKPDSTNNFIK
jgi:hypothetical protein